MTGLDFEEFLWGIGIRQEAIEGLREYFEQIYDALNVICENRDKILKRMNSTIARHIGRDTSLLFYDVTNFYFEIGDSR